jgi:hypothetical protein
MLYLEATLGEELFEVLGVLYVSSYDGTRLSSFAEGLVEWLL